jgi:hypothetical protein
MKVKPKLAYRHANYPEATSVLVEPQECYLATNQPEWEAKAKIFVDSRGGAPEMLLTRDDYTVIVEERGYYDCHGDKRVALLHEGQECKPVKFKGDVVIVEAVEQNGQRECLVELPIGATLLQMD